MKYTHDDFLRLLNNVNSNIIPIDKYVNSSTKIRFKCLIDNNIFSSTPNNILRGHGCPICSRNKSGEKSRITRLKKDKTTLMNIRPNLSKCLVNTDDAFNYGYTSKHKLNWKCSDCGYIFSRSPSQFTNDRLVCPNCIKNESYPNRFMFSILSQLGIDFLKEYSPIWIGQKRYDFYFAISDKKYIIEMDGGLHRYKDAILNDIIKDNAAMEHNINVIRINCDYGKSAKRYEFIKNNIIESKLSNLFTLNEKMFIEADKFALTNECTYITKLWETYRDVDEIKKNN